MSEELFPVFASWQLTTLSELCSGGDASIQTGPFGSALHASDYVAEGIPCVMPQDIRDGNIVTTNIARITREDHERLKGFQLRPGDIVYPRRGDITKRALVGEREHGWLCGTGCLRIRPNIQKVDPHFLSYYLAHSDVCNWIDSNAVGATMPHLNTGLAGAIPVVVPPVSIQSEIASILGALDDKIELNRRMSATLEEMARSLYRSWFVDFDPVHAKMEGRLPAFMDEATAALFPDRFGENGLPEGWESGCISDIAKLNPEKHTKKKHPNTVEYVDLSNTKWGLIELTTRYSWEEAPSRARMVLREQDTIVGTVRPGNGSYSYIGKDGLTGSTGFAVLRPMDPSDVALVYLSATDTDTIDALTNLADGGAYPAVRPDVVATQPVVLADDDVRTAFQESVSPMIAKIEASKTENQTLATLRDSLLPKLMSGEIRVGEAREQVEDVV